MYVIVTCLTLKYLHAKRKATASAVDGPPSKFLCLKSPLHLLHAIAISTYGLCDYWFRSITWKCVQRHLNIGNYCSSNYRPYQRGRSGAMSKFSSVKEYIQYTKMDKHGTWGTETELLVLSHLLKIYTYLTTDKKWFVVSVHPS